MSEQSGNPLMPVHPMGSRTHVPRGVWIGGALLAMVTAGLAGALIMLTLKPGITLPSTSMQTALLADVTPRAAVPLQVQPVTAPDVLPMGAAPASLHPSTQPARTPSVQEAARPHAVASRSQTAACANCGVVESVVPVQSKGEGTGLGAVTGGVLGAVVGNQFGGGNGKKAMAVLGAIGGGFAGHEVEKRVRGSTVYNVRLRMDDGSTRVIRREQPAVVGSRVVLNRNTF